MTFNTHNNRKNSLKFVLILFTFGLFPSPKTISCNFLKEMGSKAINTVANTNLFSKANEDPKSENSTVNVISQNAYERSQNATEVFLERLERKDVISHIQQSIVTLKDKLQDIENNVNSKLIKINASSNTRDFILLISHFWLICRSYIIYGSYISIAPLRFFFCKSYF